jgi:hypothetical protein
MDESLRRLGTPYLGEERFDVVDIGGKKAMLISYKRAALGGGSPLRVNQYHVPMRSDKMLITASIQDSAAPLMGPIVERILASLVIHR